MRWRFVRQPNDLLAVFSDIVDDFICSGLTAEQAVSQCVTTHGMRLDDANRMVKAGLEDWKRYSNGIQGSGHDRWDEAIENIRHIHGEQRVRDNMVEMGLPHPNIDCPGPSWEVAPEWADFLIVSKFAPTEFAWSPKDAAGNPDCTVGWMIYSRRPCNT